MFKQDALTHSALDIPPAGRVFAGCFDPSVTAPVLARHGADMPTKIFPAA